MPTPIPSTWRNSPPDSILVGEGVFAIAAAQVLGAARVSSGQLACGPEQNADGSLPLVLEDLNRVMLVVSENMSAADALRCHQMVWEWIEQLSSARDQHELVFIFMLLADISHGFEDTLATGLGISKIDPAATGHAVWRRSDSLSGLLGFLTNTQPMDLVPLRARRVADIKHIALARLRASVSLNDADALREAARDVLSAFSGCEYALDVFCCPPSHQNGNLLRRWLDAAVTDSVTPKEWIEGKEQLVSWLAPAQTKLIR